jgi:predicted SAM-dependent methyltransferase
MNYDPTRIQFGCGSNKLLGWQNRDREVDIRKRLPYPDNRVDYVFTEHVIEHITHPEALRFFDECYRILKPGGVARMAVPDVCRFHSHGTQAHIETVIGPLCNVERPREAAVRKIVVGYEHVSCWTGELLAMLLTCAGFETHHAAVGRSEHPYLRELEGRGVMAGDPGLNEAQTCVVEGVKPE